jgi:hypothetical protein
MRGTADFRSLGWVLAAGLVAGCGGEAADFARESVSGNVSLDDQPLEEGIITFIPVGGGDPVASGLIRQGAYSVEREYGPAPGVHTVTISAVKPTGKTRKNPDDPDNPIVETRETLPARYNLQSELQADIQAGGGNTFDFKLSSKGAAKTKTK